MSAKADEDNLVIEQNEANNSYSHAAALAVNPVSSSDLAVTADWTPGMPSAGSSVAFSVSIKNQGIVASAGGAHPVTLVLKNAAGATIQTFNTSYNGVIAAGASVNVAIPGSWTAVNGNYTVSTSIAADGNEVPAKQTNNTSSVNLVVYAQRGASVPYSRYDTEDAVKGGTAALRTAPTFDQSLTASEASGQSILLFLPMAPMPNGPSDPGRAVQE